MILLSLKCNGTKIVCLWSDTQRKVCPKSSPKKPRNDQKTIFGLFQFSQILSSRFELVLLTLMQSCCFFLPTFSWKFQISQKLSIRFFTKFCTVILHPKGPHACAKASKSYDWIVRNIAKISPKMAKDQPFFDFFRFSQKLSIRFERNFLQLFYTILESYMCNGIKIVGLGCEKHSQISQKWPKNGHFSTFFDCLKNCLYDFSRNFSQSFYTQRGPWVRKGIEIVWLECEKHCQN